MAGVQIAEPGQPFTRNHRAAARRISRAEKTDTFFSIALLCSLFACNEESEVSPVDTSGERSPSNTLEIEFGACPPCIDGSNARFACASVNMPIVPDDSESGDISIFVFKAEGKAAVKHAQVWFFTGGPGDSAAFFSPLFDQISEAHPDWDLYALDHRGVGNSTRLSCEEEE